MSRFFPREPVGKDLGYVEAVCLQAERLAVHLDKIGGREGSLAMTKLEEAVMWALKGITK